MARFDGFARRGSIVRLTDHTGARIELSTDSYQHLGGTRCLIPADTTARRTLAGRPRFNEAFNRHTVDDVMAAMTPDCVFESTSPPFGDRHVGAGAVRAAWDQFLASDPDKHELIPRGSHRARRAHVTITEGRRDAVEHAVGCHRCHHVVDRVTFRITS